ncbi:MAG TPA: hypothetical protein PKB07_08185 [Flavilitoribacter sp.]|nr:hypothetical protein [Flavilitoribacter sp.]
MKNSRQIFAPIWFLVFALFSGCDAGITPDCPDPSSFNYSPDAAGSIICYDMRGCLGYQPGLAYSGSVGSTFNDPGFDRMFKEETALQSAFFQDIPANVLVLYEPSEAYANCYATYSGEILFGYYYYQKTRRNYGLLPLAGTLSHEFGHLVQYDGKWNDYGAPFFRELEADAFSGLYMALYKAIDWQHIQTYYANVYDSGDFLYNDPTHHGTPEERLAAARLGVEVAVAIMQEGAALTYDELHELFLDKIMNTIAPRSTDLIEYPDIAYPELSPAQRKALFPHK